MPTNNEEPILSSDTTEIVFEDTVGENGSITIDPIQIKIYNKSNNALTDVKAELELGEVFSARIDDNISPNKYSTLYLSSSENLTPGVYEDKVTISSGENSLIIPIKYIIKEMSGEGSEPTTTPTPIIEPSSSMEPTKQPTSEPTEALSSPSAKPTSSIVTTMTPTVVPTSIPTTSANGPSAPKIKSLKNLKGKKMTVKWKKVKGANGYQVQYALNSKFTKSKKSVTTTTTNYSKKGLKKKMVYYVRVRAYVKNSKGKKIYGDWSKVKKIKIKK